jgi:Activator of Hsp90 ATPase homolog 1-like protein
MTPLPPVEHQVIVRLDPDRAFTLFTQDLRRWWPFPGHSVGGEATLDVVFEPRVGGAVTEVIGPAGTGAGAGAAVRAGSGTHERVPWGVLTAWDPPRGFAMRWHPGLDADQATFLRVSFHAVGEGTAVSVHHSGWEARGEAAADKRDQYDGGWPTTLAAFAAAALAAQETS